MIGLRVAKKLRQYVKPLKYNTGTWRTDRQTISISRVSALTRDKMYLLCNNKIWDILLICVITELTTSNLVQNCQGAGLRQHHKNLGPPSYFCNRWIYSITTSFLYTTGFGYSSVPKRAKNYFYDQKLVGSRLGKHTKNLALPTYFRNHWSSKEI